MVGPDAPILVNIPAKLLFVAALALAVGAFVRDVIRRRREQDRPVELDAALRAGRRRLLIGSRPRSGSQGRAVREAWTPVPIYAYGVMLGTSLVVGWFIAMRLAKQDGIDQQEAGNDLHVGGGLVDHRLAPSLVITNLSEFDSITQVVMVNRGGLVAYGGMIGGFLATWYCCRKRGIPLLQWADVAAPSVVLGTAITRVGCLLFGCDYGARSNLPWAIRFRAERWRRTAARPGTTTCTTSGCRRAPRGRIRCTRRRSTNRWSGCSCSRC